MFHKILHSIEECISLSSTQDGLGSLLCNAFFDPSIPWNLVGSASVGIRDALLTSEDGDYKRLLDIISMEKPHLSLLWTSVVFNYQAIPSMALQDLPPICLVAAFWTNTLQSFLQVVYHQGTTPNSTIPCAREISISFFCRPEASIQLGVQKFLTRKTTLISPPIILPGKTTRAWLASYFLITPEYILYMAKNKDLTFTMRARICELHSIGWGYRRIHQRYPQIPFSTVRYTVINQNDRNDHISKPRSGRPPILSPEQKDHLHKLAIEDPHIKMRELQAAVDSSPSKDTVRRLFRNLHMKK